MDLNNNILPDANVEEMSNAELFQYLFKAELDSSGPDPFTHGLFDVPVDAPVPVFDSNSSTASVASSLSPPPQGSFSASPTSSTLSYSSPLATELEHDQDQDQEKEQPQPQSLSSSSFPSFYPTLLPSTSFSYRQLTPNMPPSMPTSLAPFAKPTTEAQTQFQDLANTATATALPQDQMTFWMQRFQQLQQLHHQQRQQLLSSALFNSADLDANLASGSSQASSSQPAVDSHSQSPSPLSVSLAGSPEAGSDRDPVYPSPPMKDDVSMDSDSDDGSPGLSSRNGKETDPLMPSASELKKMTSKERRQLRNKLSARNFRVRRKEYIGKLENQVKDARREAADLQKKLAQSELNCQFLRQELEMSRLSQTLFNDGRMSRQHANLLASLLNPNTESFPTASANLPIPASLTQQQQQKELMEHIHSNNMTILNYPMTSDTVLQTPNISHLSNTPSTIVPPTTTTAAMTMPVAPTESLASQTDIPASLQAFVPFSGDWELIVNRAELDINPALDPKEVQSKQEAYHDLLSRYEAAKRDAEVDEQMRAELQAYQDQKLAQTYIVMPKEESALSMTTKAAQDNMFLQAFVYMMMIHLTRSLFEAATLSKSQLVNVLQMMDGPLRTRMIGQEEQQRPHCKFAEWREAWIKRCWPSFYNNRQRVCELFRNGCATLTGEDVTETVRKMEEGVEGRTVETPFCAWVRSYLPTWLRCPDRTQTEEREPLMTNSSEKQRIEVIV
ncbi:hypothetical protein BGW38_003217 [Lunasporangiospora selenospora]|uniref:BZIP domain-containing protein n=1 Tax=Lunasporangiospora selenospora TaxID=979761 RepID=A0A9P6FS56_9FUNG|nr:hypothetical protein BGW38_003217 [Lunasporangiospora selenospora]